MSAAKSAESSNFFLIVRRTPYHEESKCLNKPGEYACVCNEVSFNIQSKMVIRWYYRRQFLGESFLIISCRLENLYPGKNLISDFARKVRKY